MRIRLTYGIRQQFRFRYRDLTISGRVERATFPLRRAVYRLNNSKSVSFYVEPIPDPGIDWVTQYKTTPAELRCKDLGDFTIEIPVSSNALAEGANLLQLEFVDASGLGKEVVVEFAYDPTPLPLPLDLRDLGRFSHIQEVGQIVNGAFDLDIAANVIRSRAPVYPDAFLVLGSPHSSQEATYTVRFLDLTGVKWLGPSDFFVGFEHKDPPIGIKTGWSTAGMATLSPRHEARAFVAWGDHSGTKDEWVVVTSPPKRFTVQKDVVYRVRHQITFSGGVDRTRFRIWREDEAEPAEWLCEEDDSRVPTNKMKWTAGSFGLFQHSGMPIEWSDILVRAL